MENIKAKYPYVLAGLLAVVLLIWYLIESPDINTAGYVLTIISLFAGVVFIYSLLKNKLQNSVKASQVFIGVIFLFSGFVKAVDPMGTMYKITDYFNAFGLDFLKPVALPIAFILCCYEFPLGFAILFGLRGKLMSWLLLLIMSFFSVFTLYLAFNNPVTDCGCFGDALILTNWETFLKNLAIMAFVVFLFQYRKLISPFLFKKIQWAGIFIGIAIVLFISGYSYLYLPILDFRPYKVGKDIYAQTIIPEGEQGDVYETVLIYKNVKTDESMEFDIEHIPTTNEWEWQETINKLISEGYKPPIHDFHISNNFGEEITTEFFDQKGYRLLIIQNKLEESNLTCQKYLNQLVSGLQSKYDIKIWALTSSLEEDQEVYIKENNVPYLFYLADPVMLKTIIRSNPGLLLLKDNQILKKWPARRIPGKELIETLMVEE